MAVETGVEAYSSAPVSLIMLVAERCFIVLATQVVSVVFFRSLERERYNKRQLTNQRSICACRFYQIGKGYRSIVSFFELLEYLEVDGELSRSKSGRLTRLSAIPYKTSTLLRTVTYFCPAHSLYCFTWRLEGRY